MRRPRIRIHDLVPYPPVHITAESSTGRDDRARLTRDVCIAQNVVIADLHRQLRALEAQLRLAQLRAEWAAARAEELERQHRALLEWIHEATNAGLLDDERPARRPLWRRLLKR
jgi:hypothetical protein